jgi:cytochrome c
MLAVVLGVAACDESIDTPYVPGGDPARGELLVQGYGCGTCHSIPDIPGADANVGPPLTGFARQAYIAGVLPNQPANLVLWIMDPPAIDPRTAMPNLGVNETDARDMASYIYTLEER